MCNGVHNPIVSSIIIISFILGQLMNSSSAFKTVLAQTTSQLMVEEAINGTIDGEPISYIQDTTTNTSFDDYFYDLLSNIINLVFIYRFVKRSNSPYQSRTNSVYQELCIFIMQLVAATYFISTYFTQFPKLLQILTSLQLVLPFIIFFISISSNRTIYKPLKECNNNILPFFITNSFLFINTTFTTSTSTSACTLSQLIGWLYLFAAYSQKLYLIYQYVIYELITVYEEEEDDEEVEKQNDEKHDLEKGALNRSSNHSTFLEFKNRLMMSVCYIVMGVDLVFMCLLI